jgi:hypothetical protein
MNGRIRSFIDDVFRLYFDEEGGGGNVGDVTAIPHGVDGDVELMGQDDGDGDAGSDDDAAGDEESDEETDDDKKKDKKKVVKEGDDQEQFQEDDEEEEGTDDEEEEEGDDKEGKEGDDKVFEGRPRLSDLKKAFPEIYKKFPELRDVIAREYKFSQQFGTIEEAEEASAKAKNFDFLESGLLDGDPGEVYKQLAENSPDSLKKLADTVLPRLLEQSQDLYMRATVPVIEQFLWTLKEQGRSAKDPNLFNSAMHAAKWFFGKPEIPDPTRRVNSNEPHPAEKKLADQQKAWSQTRFKEASGEVSGAIDVEMNLEIAKGLSLPQGTTQKQKDAFMSALKDEVDATLGKDEAFKRQMKALWKKAGDADYPRDQRSQIKSAFLARAKALVPGIRTRLREEWFGKAPVNNDKGKTADKDKQQTPPKKKRVISDSGRAPQQNGPKRPPSAKQVDWTRTSDEDLINGRFTPKRF